MKLGKAFSDSLIIEQKKERRHIREESESWWLGAGRALILATFLTLAFFVLGWRLFSLTVIEGSKLRVLADSNRTRELIRHAARGILRDRTDKPLVENVAQYRLIRPCEEPDSVCITRLTREEGEALETKGLAPGEFLEKDYQRIYLFDEALAHALGYTGEITTEELRDEYYSVRNYFSGDRIGRMGAEALFEERLRGRDGRDFVEIDAKGNILRVLGAVADVPGEDITLSFDARLSEVAATAFREAGTKGAVVVSKPLTGEVFALYSSPSFSPNMFSSGLSRNEYQRLVEDPQIPMFNRAIGGVYPPGSTFKIITSIAGLEEGAISASTIVEDVGELKIGPFTFPNWYFKQYGKTEGSVDLVKALERSNDIYFYKAGEWLGITKLARWASKLGIGKPLGIELAGEAAGLMPDPAWKATHFNTSADREARSDQWYLGDTYHISIGQGYLLATPLQVNAWTNVIANGGKLCKPTIEKMKNENLKMKNCEDLTIKEETIELITRGMKAACEEGGTGWPLFNFQMKNENLKMENGEATPAASFTRIPIACKTGTAEFGDPDDRTHAWFTAFAPLPAEALAKAGLREGEEVLTGEPEISVTVLVEEGGEGSSVAAPVAKKILEEWFRR